MALKFLNKKGWHTGSLRNIENVWKAEQKHEAEQKKLEELRKQIHEERERAEFRQLQEQAGLIPKQERLDFLYESGLAVGKGGPGFKALESLPKTDPETASSSTANKQQQQQSAVPGALFEDKPQSANDAWRKLHSDPLLLIRQKEQEALARVKNNPIQMAMIRKSIEAKGKDKYEKKHRKKQRKKPKHRKHSSSENDSDSEDADLTAEKKRNDHGKGSKSHNAFHRTSRTSDEEADEADDRRRPYYDKDHQFQRRSGASNHRHDNKYDKSDNLITSRSSNNSQRKEHHSEQHVESRHDKRSHFSSPDKPPRHESNNSHRRADKLTEEERAAKLREMQMDAELHEEQRWKRIKKAADNDAQEAIHDHASRGRNFLDATQKSIYGAEKGGSSTIEESLRRRTHYSQGRSATDTNAFRRS